VFLGPVQLVPHPFNPDMFVFHTEYLITVSHMASPCNETWVMALSDWVMTRTRSITLLTTAVLNKMAFVCYCGACSS
jgi:hypothetical protein